MSIHLPFNKCILINIHLSKIPFKHEENFPFIFEFISFFSSLSFPFAHRWRTWVIDFAISGFIIVDYRHRCSIDCGLSDT